MSELYVSGCQLSTDAFRVITNFPNLKILDASENFFGEVPENFNFGKSCLSLESIKLEFCDITIHCLKAITDCPNLKSLIISNSNLIGLEDDFELGCSKQSLEYLDISNCSLNLNQLKIFTNCPKLKSLFADKNYLHLKSPSVNNSWKFEFGSSKNSLQFISLNQNKILHEFLKAITDCSSIFELSFVECTFLNMNEPIEIGKLANSLTTVDFTESYFSSILFLCALGECKNLKFIILKNCEWNHQIVFLEFSNYLLRRNNPQLNLVIN